MFTYQELEAAREPLGELLGRAIRGHLNGEGVRVARAADEYDRQRNITVNGYTKFIAEHSQNPLVDVTAANNRIPSNFFHQLNVQRCAYLLGNGVSFAGGAGTKALLGPRFDRDFYELARLALIHGESFGFWNRDRLWVFPITQFVPFYDERTGALRAGLRFWRLTAERPMRAALYTADGVVSLEERDGVLMEVGREPYLVRGMVSKAEGFVPVEEAGYQEAPLVHMYGSSLHQSTLVGLRQKIDAYDLIQSGFANDLMDCAQIYWIIENCGGMKEADLRDFLNRLTRDHVATADTRGMGVDASGLKPFVQDVPFESRMAWLQFIRASIYEGFGALDVRALSAGNRTATEIDAAYQPLDEAADDFEVQCTDAVKQVLAILGVEDEPLYKRNKVCNQYEQTRTVMLAAGVLDREAVVRHLPWVTVDEADRILSNQIEN